MTEKNPKSDEANVHRAIEEIVHGNRLLSLSTTDGDATPHGNAMYFAPQGLSRLIVLTGPDSSHAKFGLERSTVAATIFDSTQPFGGDLRGLQLRGKWRRCPAQTEEEAFEIYAGRFPKLREWAGSAQDMERRGMESRLFEIIVRWYKVLNEPTLGKEVYLELSL